MKRLVTLGARVARSNLARGRRPFKLTLIVTWTCDTRCKMCSIWKRDKDGVMTVEEVAAFFAANPGFSWINLSGGEIWTRPDAGDLVAAVIDGSPDLYLLDFPTTGQKTERIVEGVEQILDRKVPKVLVTVSLDGPREVHDDIRGVKGAFDRAMATFARLRTLRSRRFDCFLGTTLSRFNAGSLFPTYEAAREVIPDLDLREIHVNLAQESAHYYQNVGQEVGPAPGEGTDDAALLEELDRFVRARGRSLHPVALLERRYQRLVPEFLRTGLTPVPCKALSSSVFVDARWNVYPCSMWDAPMGNLRDHGFDLGALWETDDTEEMRRTIADRRCPNCWTPCEAYQSLLGSVTDRGRAPTSGD